MTASPTGIAESPEPAGPRHVYRVEVRPRPGEIDPLGQGVLREARGVWSGVDAVHTARVYLIETKLNEQAVRRVAEELLGDPVSQQVTLGAAPPEVGAAVIEVHYQPGVMDPVAQSTRDAMIEMLPDVDADDVAVRTGFRYDLSMAMGASPPTAEELRSFAERALANPVIQDIHLTPFHPDAFPHGQAYVLSVLHVPMRELDDAALMRLSREGHLFLSLAEMQAIQQYYRDAEREPTDAELETLAQTWSEHCVHKTLKSTVRYMEEGATHAGLRFEGRPGHTINADGSVTIDNLLKSTVAAATRRLMESEPHRTWCVSVFEDNAGIVRFDDEDGVCIKVETHNHPSAIEPYGGAATGIGGCIRDILGTGLAARPIANTDTFAVAFPGLGDRASGRDKHSDASDSSSPKPDPRDPSPDLPRGVIHPKRVLRQVVAGVRDYGNRMGIPTLNGAVYFHDDFLGNPLVFAGCVGIIPLDKCFGHARPGDRIIALGGATGRDGIHGATFSSAELTDTHADEFSHAVQIGNPITQKKMMDVILQARDAQGGPLFSAITDCGAGGFSSAVGEMGEKVGAHVTLDTAPLKYAGLSYTEIWISEAQERMVLAVPAESVDALRAMCEAEDVGFCDLGVFGCGPDGPTPPGSEPPTEPTLQLTYAGTHVGQLPMHLLHEGIPTPTREATWSPAQFRNSEPKPETRNPKSEIPLPPASNQGEELHETLMALLGHPNIASKHWIIRQYDHEVQGSSVVKPLVGPEQDGPSDAAVIRPKLDSQRGIALACGLAPQLSEKALTTGDAIDGDSYWATLAALDEAVRNAVCVGADPMRMAILDNFCWPKCDDPKQMGSLVRAAEACYDGAMAYGTPFVSGKDSLSNQFTTDTGRVITIPPTLLISALGIVPDVTRCRTMDAKAAGNVLLMVGRSTSQLGGSHYRMLTGDDSRNLHIPRADLKLGPITAQAVAKLIAQGLVASAHDCSEGGLLVAAAEMAFAGRIGLDLDLTALPIADRELDAVTACFGEAPGRYLLEVSPAQLEAVVKLLSEAGVAAGQVGTFAAHDKLTLRTPRDGQVLTASLNELRQAWLRPLDW